MSAIARCTEGWMKSTVGTAQLEAIADVVVPMIAKSYVTAEPF